MTDLSDKIQQRAAKVLNVVAMLQRVGLDVGSTSISRVLASRGEHISPSTVRRDLDRLQSLGVLVVSGTGAGTRYALSESAQPPIDLRFGRYQDVLSNDTWDHAFADTPNDSRVHEGHNSLNLPGRRTLDYPGWSPEEAAELVRFLIPRTRGWIGVLCDHVLARTYEAEMSAAGRYVFAPVPCVVWGSRCRLVGDGPSCITTQLVLSRPIGSPFPCGTPAHRWGTMPGAYSVGRGPRSPVMGAKPVSLLIQIIRDYTRPGDLVCDPCFGGGTTAIACDRIGRDFIGSECRRPVFDRACADVLQ